MEQKFLMPTGENGTYPSLDRLARLIVEAIISCGETLPPGIKVQYGEVGGAKYVRHVSWAKGRVWIGFGRELKSGDPTEVTNASLLYVAFRRFTVFWPREIRVMRLELDMYETRGPELLVLAGRLWRWRLKKFLSGGESYHHMRYVGHCRCKDREWHRHEGVMQPELRRTHHVTYLDRGKTALDYPPLRPGEPRDVLTRQALTAAEESMRQLLVSVRN